MIVYYNFVIIIEGKNIKLMFGMFVFIVLDILVLFCKRCFWVFIFFYLIII